MLKENDELRALQADTIRIEADLSNNKDVRIAYLCTQVENLTQQLQDTESEAATTSQDWQTSYTELESRFLALTEQNTGLKLNPCRCRWRQVMFEDKEIRIADLKAQVNDLTKELHDSGVEGIIIHRCNTLVDRLVSTSTAPDVKLYKQPRYWPNGGRGQGVNF